MQKDETSGMLRRTYRRRRKRQRRRKEKAGHEIEYGKEEGYEERELGGVRKE